MFKEQKSGVQAGELAQCCFSALRRNTIAGYIYFAIADVFYSQTLAGPFSYDNDYQPIKQHMYHGKSQFCNPLTASSPGVGP